MEAGGKEHWMAKLDGFPAIMSKKYQQVSIHLEYIK